MEKKNTKGKIKKERKKRSDKQKKNDRRKY